MDTKIKTKISEQKYPHGNTEFFIQTLMFTVTSTCNYCYTNVSTPTHTFVCLSWPLSLSFRLFGNILADELVVGVLVALVPLVVPIPLMLLGLFTSAIQALVFATLAGAYIGEALEDHH